MEKSKKFLILGNKRMYTENFKKSVVAEVESGRLSKESARVKYEIKGKSAVLNWCRQYGKLNYKPKSVSSLTMIDKLISQTYKKRIKELEQELSSSKLKVSYLENVVELLQEQGVIDAVKKSDTPLLGLPKRSIRKTQ